MKIITQIPGRAMLRFDKDEEVFAGLIQYAKGQKIQSGFFTAIGSCSAMELGYYNPHLKQYRKKPYVDNYEIVSLIGNIAWAGETPAVHAHGIFGMTDFTLIGGHVFSIKTLATCEVHLTILEGPAKRTLNPEFNLNLLD